MFSFLGRDFSEDLQYVGSLLNLLRPWYLINDVGRAINLSIQSPPFLKKKEKEFLMHFFSPGRAYRGLYLINWIYRYFNDKPYIRWISRLHK